MYQSLIWAAVLRHDARGLGTALDAEDLQCLANALIDRVRGDQQLSGNLFRGQMLVDKAQAIELPSRQARHALSHRVIIGGTIFVGGVRQTRRLLQS
jgi:hypothetical protein